jgi:lipoprotein-releasing system permease protein
MFQPLPLSIGLRYTRAKRRNHFISFISLVSMLGIALGVTALITVISVMNGFEQELRARILGMVSHATISGAGEPLANWPRAVELALADPRVVGAAPYVEAEAMLHGLRDQAVLLRGIDPTREATVSDLAGAIKVGSFESLEPGAFNIVIGRELAMSLGVAVGDTVQVFVATGSFTPVGFVPRAKAFRVSGIFELGLQEADMKLGLIHLQDAQRLMRMGDAVSGVRLKLADMFQAWNVARDLSDRLESVYRIRDWAQDNASFFRAIKTEKTVMFVILSLIIAVAAFNLVSSLIMLVTDKQADIAILRTLGMTPRQIMAVFVVQGTVIGVIGVALGVLGGVLLTLNLEYVVAAVEALFGFEVMPADIYYISGVPTVLRGDDVGLITVMALVLCTLATLYPAWRAARTDPAAALRYE